MRRDEKDFAFRGGYQPPADCRQTLVARYRHAWGDCEEGTVIPSSRSIYAKWELFRKVPILLSSCRHFVDSLGAATSRPRDTIQYMCKKLGDFVFMNEFAQLFNILFLCAGGRLRALRVLPPLRHIGNISKVIPRVDPYISSISAVLSPYRATPSARSFSAAQPSPGIRVRLKLPS